MSSISTLLNRVSNWKTLVGLILIDVLFVAVLLKNAEEKMNAMAGKIIGPIDLTFGFNPRRTLRMIEDYGDAARDYYMSVELTIDLAYPLVYAFLFAVAITLIYRRLLGGPVRYLNVLPFIAMCFDYLENIAIVFLLKNYPEQSLTIAILCEFFKLIKWLLFGLVIFLVLYGLIKLLLNIGRK